MVEALNINPHPSRSKKYPDLLPQIAAIMQTETDLIANLANISSILKEVLGFFWVGFYRRSGDDLVLGPFQGLLACTRIPMNRGVCGTCAREKRTIIVPDVDKFPEHIACSSLSRSELVIPLIHNNRVELILDIDSIQLNDFDDDDVRHLEELVTMIKHHHFTAAI